MNRQANAPSSDGRAPIAWRAAVLATWLSASTLTAAIPAPSPWDLWSDTWSATDALGRALPDHTITGPPRSDRTIGLFYFLWHGQHIQGGPYDITEILRLDPDAMQKPESPLWGPLHAPHHWAQSIFGYYLTDDQSVLRKHAQMLADAGVDAIFFDVSNQLTYRPYYEALLRAFEEARQQGGNPPQIAFLCPFWDPASVVRQLYQDLYQPGLFRDQWFRWKGKPLVLADPERLQTRSGNDAQSNPTPLEPGHTLAQSFTITNALLQAGGRFPTWMEARSGMTLSLFAGESAHDTPIVRQQFESVPDNGWMMLRLAEPAPPGNYLLQMSSPRGRIGWWSHHEDRLPGGRAFVDGQPATGDRTLRLVTDTAESRELLHFFTFRKPQPDYFRGPTEPNMWSWLEVSPQHIFTNQLGQPEQMSVGVAQNAVKGRLGAMSEPGAQGRSFHNGARDGLPNAVRFGWNPAEQWAHALKVDPHFIFITGWNEWIAGRFNEFNGVRRPVMFVDQFDQEHSRDIEPMLGGHGDDYYYQMVANIRRYKGTRPLPRVQSKPIQIDGSFADWDTVQPEFRDTIGDPVHRDHRGWGQGVRYVNQTGRHDLVSAKISLDGIHLCFLVRTREPLGPVSATNWMMLFLDTDADPATGWMGYDFVVNRTHPTANDTSLEQNVNDAYAWRPVARAPLAIGMDGLELALPRAQLGLAGTDTFSVDFKWADDIQQTGDWSDFTLNGDAAPNDRFNYRASFTQ